jgi:hypothetical protein
MLYPQIVVEYYPEVAAVNTGRLELTWNWDQSPCAAHPGPGAPTRPSAGTWRQRCPWLVTDSAEPCGPEREIGTLSFCPRLKGIWGKP